MTSSLSDIVIPSLSARLGTALSLLTKAQAHAEAKNITPSALIEARLRPDMFALAGQFEAIGDTTRRGLERLTGQEPSSVGSPAPAFEALGAYLKDTLHRVEHTDKDALDAHAAQSLIVGFGPTTKMEFTGHSYAYAFLLPNTMFHVSMAYAILRERGVELGKLDLLGAFVQQFDIKPIA